MQNFAPPHGLGSNENNLIPAVELHQINYPQDRNIIRESGAYSGKRQARERRIVINSCFRKFSRTPNPLHFDLHFYNGMVDDTFYLEKFCHGDFKMNDDGAIGSNLTFGESSLLKDDQIVILDNDNLHKKHITVKNNAITWEIDGSTGNATAQRLRADPYTQRLRNLISGNWFVVSTDDNQLYPRMGISSDNEVEELDNIIGAVFTLKRKSKDNINQETDASTNLYDAIATSESRDSTTFEEYIIAYHSVDAFQTYTGDYALKLKNYTCDGEFDSSANESLASVDGPASDIPNYFFTHSITSIKYFTSYSQVVYFHLNSDTNTLKYEEGIYNIQDTPISPLPIKEQNICVSTCWDANIPFSNTVATNDFLLCINKYHFSADADSSTSSPRSITINSGGKSPLSIPDIEIFLFTQDSLVLPQITTAESTELTLYKVVRPQRELSIDLPGEEISSLSFDVILIPKHLLEDHDDNILIMRVPEINQRDVLFASSGNHPLNSKTDIVLNRSNETKHHWQFSTRGSIQMDHATLLNTRTLTFTFYDIDGIQIVPKYRFQTQPYEDTYINVDAVYPLLPEEYLRVKNNRNNAYSNDNNVIIDMRLIRLEKQYLD
uniref:Uncharacterized protein n=1 Tax=Megaviridae environmental sample TaxID=1737588 RepID=A0A5J6VI04_9VIRU|nr:MAG: hypothetical protein [Megaviridae environmental sample]